MAAKPQQTPEQFINLATPKSGASPANAINIFRGRWTYKLPLEGVESGERPTFLHEPPGVKLMRQYIANIDQLDVLELGPHEGEHTYHLNRLARHVYSVEGRPANYLKCVIVKNEVGMGRVRFALGDAVEYLEHGKKLWDICYCAGFLYHMADPENVIRLIARRAKHLVLTTVVVDWEEMEKADKRTEMDPFPTRWCDFIEREPNERGYYRRMFDSSMGHLVIGQGASHTEFASLVTANRLQEIIAASGGKTLHWHAYADHRSPHIEAVVAF